MAHLLIGNSFMKCLLIISSKYKRLQETDIDIILQLMKENKNKDKRNQLIHIFKKISKIIFTEINYSNEKQVEFLLC